MKRFIASAAAATALAGSAAAQFPQLAGAPSPTNVFPLGGAALPPGVPQGIAPQAAVPDGPTVWSKLGVSKAQLEACRREMCGKPIGRVLGTVISPMSKLTGGLIPGFCPTTPTVADLLDPGAVGAASKVKMDRLAAEKRAEAVEYLGSADCHYWPEAEEALINALRNDRNECVRYTAAVTLGKGCCCTCKVIVALSHSVSCSDKDGAPWEKSARVRSAAAVALEKCMQSACCPADLPPVDDGKAKENNNKEKGEKEEGEGKKTGSVNNAAYMAPATAKPGPNARDAAEPLTMKEYYAAVPRVPRNTILNNARSALDVGRRIGFTPTEEVNANDYVAAGNAAAPRRATTLMDALAGGGDPTPAAAARPAVPAPIPAPAPAPVAASVARTAIPVDYVPTKTFTATPAVAATRTAPVMPAVAAPARSAPAMPTATAPVRSAPVMPAMPAVTAPAAPKFEPKAPAPKPVPVVMPTPRAAVEKVPATVATAAPKNAAPIERIAAPATVPPLPVYGAPAGAANMDPVPVTPAARPTQYGPVYNPYGLR